MRAAIGTAVPTIFINYRTGDGDKTAQIIDTALSARFGSERVIRAAKSIQPGENYVEGLLSRVAASSALIAVIGPTWESSPRLSDPQDWVRREILLAMERGIYIIPVLDGRRVERLRAAHLPAELARFAELHSVRLDPQDLEAKLRDLGDLLAARVPGLREVDSTKPDREQRPEDRTGSRNRARGVHGPVAQGDSLFGGIHNTYRDVTGVHLGPRYDYSPHVTDYSHHVDNSRHVGGDYHETSAGGAVNTGAIHGPGSVSAFRDVHATAGRQPDPSRPAQGQADPERRAHEERAGEEQ